MLRAPIEDEISLTSTQYIRLECLKVAASIHTSSVDMTLAGAERMYKWLVTENDKSQPETKQINS